MKWLETFILRKESEVGASSKMDSLASSEELKEKDGLLPRFGTLVFICLLVAVIL